ncbi:MAG: alpha/beta hydrolase [Xanthobacteraceae bacterium]|nr:MAG: alpha/beta hydrolase [Xanthobacteraceae bacterium]
MPAVAGEGAFESRFVTAKDGLRLHARVYGGAAGGPVPLVCLPGLSRNSGDFDVLARALAPERPVIALDYRGRGLSGWDANWQNYALPVELEDVFGVLAALGLDRAIFLGTSRGGLLTMLTGMARPDLLAGAILNDIGPVIEGAGLARIRAYLGRLREPSTIDEAIALLKDAGAGRFPALTDDDWRGQAESIWTDRDGAFAPAFDPALAKTLETADFSQPLPTLWPQFDGLGGVPLMVIRGEHSDILSEATVAAMVERRPDLLLTDSGSIGRIAAFVRRRDAA